MAITNRQIIAMECAERGIEQEIHTFAAWRDLGFSVKKGERSTIKFPIWKYAGKKDKETGDEVNAHCFMKVAAFFTSEQVEPITSGKIRTA